MAEADSSIRALYRTAKALSEQLSQWEANSQTYQDNLRRAISSFERCREVIDRASLFSENESADDIASNDLQYLAVEYWLGELVPRQKVAMSARKKLLAEAQDAYSRYLGRMDDYELLSKSDKKLQERFLENRNGFSLLAGGDAMQRRETKIMRFKQEKELKQKLEYLSQRDPALLDDSTVRLLQLAQLTLYTHQTFQALDLIAQELGILANIPDIPERNGASDDTRSRTAAREGYSERLDAPLSQLLQNGKAGPILSKEGKPLKPFTLLDSRQRLINGVFKPDHSLPTMTIDEYLDEEKRRGGMIEGGGEQSGNQPEPDEDNMEKADAETMKKREWDEFVEANPKGSGNTLNRG
ncbi:hypothetical protein MMC25_005674 [Agyrium rufum]|nr:hypothetical protein [Agyrium rufum]